VGAFAAIDLNVDLGERPGAEGVAGDARLIGLVTSANVACGFHAGDVETMRATCAAAVAAGVRIGAHVGYRDLETFGRRALDVAPARLREESDEQLAALAEAARAEGATVTYVKPHGALYHRCGTDAEAAEAITAAAAACEGIIAMLGLPGAALLATAERHGLRTVAEGFADRGYAASGQLLGRDEPGATLEAAAAGRQAVALATGAPVALGDGERALPPVGSLCLHSDGPGAHETARAVRAALADARIELRPFT